jgi:dTDP-4-dehydrorhamnose 3,5-epimerase
MEKSFSNYSEELFDNKELKVHKTKIPGMLIIDLVLHGDERGWFKESFQQEKLIEQGFPKDFIPVQNNVSSNKETGVTRGIHAEPWNKYISLTRGEVFVAIVDLRDIGTFGTTETLRMTPNKAIYVPKGCGNSYQTLSPNVEYSYLVDAHWTPEASYTMLNLADSSLEIKWPIPLEQAVLSEKDKKHPFLNQIRKKK